MAISGGDGSIILTTEIDESGIQKGSKSIKDVLNQLGNYAKTTGTKILSTFKTTFLNLPSVVKSFTSKVVTAFRNMTTKIQGFFGRLKASFGALGSFLLTYFSIYTLITFTNEASKMASETEASVQRLIDIYGEASQSVGDFIDANAMALGMSRSAATQFSAVYGNLFSVWADQETNAKLTNAYLRMTAVVASKTGRTIEDVQERVRSGLLGNTEAIEDLGIFVNIKTIEITDAFQRMANGKSWEQLDAYTQQQIRSMAILEQATEKYGTQVAKTTAFTRQQFNAAFEEFKNTWGQVVNTVLMPILRIATRILNTLTEGLRVLANLPKKTIDSNTQFKEQSEYIGNAVDSQEELTEAVKDTAKEQKKLLAGFDDLQILARNNVDGNGTNNTLDNNIPILDTLDTTLDAVEYTSKLALIGAITGWALVGLGIVVMFSGHPFIGAAMAATGFALVVGSAEGGKELGKKEKQKLQEIGIVTGLALIGLGVMMLFTKFWKLGLGMVAAGASGIYLALSLGEFPEDMKKKVIDILLLTGLVLVVLGVILLFVPHAWKIGLGMLAAGATAIFIASGLDWSEVKNTISEFFKDNWDTIIGVSVALVCLGIILCIMNLWGVGLTLIGTGAVGIFGVTATNWNGIKTEISRFVLDNYNMIVTWSAALLVLGTILLFVPGCLGVGLTLVGLGAGSLWGATAISSQALSQKLTGALNDVNNVAQSGVNKINGTLSGIGIPESDIYGVNSSIFEDVPGIATGTTVPTGNVYYDALQQEKAKRGAETIFEGNVGGNTEVVLEIDGREFGRAVVEQGNRENRRIGTRLVFE